MHLMTSAIAHFALQAQWAKQIHEHLQYVKLLLLSQTRLPIITMVIAQR